LGGVRCHGVGSAGGRETDKTGGMLDGFAETLQAAQAGEEWAIACLWRDVQPRLLRYLAARERGAAEDVASETWLRAARRLAGFRGGESEFRAWMFTIARHALIDWQRRVRRRPVVAAGSDDVADGGWRHDPADEAIERLETERALGLIRRLSPDQAEVILLRVVAGLDVARVAQILGKKPQAVRVLQHRGLRRLAELVAANDPVGEDVTR
jgi:RNA polymerase sigma-70 factor, ECF subfamily